MRRRGFLGIGLALAGCAEQVPPRTDFAPLSYDYLLKLQLNVGSIEEAPPPPPGPFDAQDPVPPIDALFQMARDRLVAAGSGGKAVFVIDQAEISRVSNGLQGVFAVHLDIVAPDGRRAGFAEAQVSRQIVGIEDVRGGLYDLTRQMMQDMNVEFEFQVRRSLRDYLQESGAAPAPAPVQQQSLPSPGSPQPAAPEAM